MSKVNAKDHVLPWVKRRKSFTTGQVAKQFSVTAGQAAALVAILRIKDAIEPNGKGSDGTSSWTVV